MTLVVPYLMKQCRIDASVDVVIIDSLLFVFIIVFAGVICIIVFFTIRNCLSKFLKARLQRNSQFHFPSSTVSYE